MRELGKTSRSGGKNKSERVKTAAKKYLDKIVLFLRKLDESKNKFPIGDHHDLAVIVTLEHFLELAEKHIDLLERRILKGEKIPHEEKLFSIFEQYTEWVNKGKRRPELGKKLTITTDQYGLIVDYKLMSNEQDRDIVLELADRLLGRYSIESWSFDKGYWSKENKSILQLEVAQVIMPKLGRRNKEEEAEETSASFKRLKNKHSAIESNINELENRGLNRCPDHGFEHYKVYIGLGVCAFNLRKMGSAILKKQRRKLELKRKKQAA